MSCNQTPNQKQSTKLFGLTQRRKQVQLALILLVTDLFSDGLLSPVEFEILHGQIQNIFDSLTSKISGRS